MSSGTARTIAEGDLFESEREAPRVAAATPARRRRRSTFPRRSCRSPKARSCTPIRTASRLLYRLLWRLQVEPALRGHPLDPDWLRADAMAQEVRREMHRMKAAVRFRAITGDDGAPLHVAWFDPEHHVVEATAPGSRAASPRCDGRS